MAVTEQELEVVRGALSEASHAWRNGRPQLDLPAALAELALWLSDGQQASIAYSGQWVSLVDDVLATVDECGPAVVTALLSPSPHAIAELRQCRSELKNSKRGRVPDLAMRRRLARASDGMRATVANSQALAAAFEDLLAAGDPLTRAGRARLLISLAGEAGHDPTWFPSNLVRLLADDLFAVAAARGEEIGPEAEPRASAGATAQERVELARARLAASPERGQAVVWLRFAFADLGWPPVLALGDAVKLFEEKWLSSVITHDRAQLEEHAPEIATEAHYEIERFVRDLDDEADDDQRDRPSTYLRVRVTDATSAGALETARHTADAISGLVSLYGTPATLWELDNSYIVRTEHGGGGSSWGAPRSRALSTDEWVAVRNDHSGTYLAEIADRLGHHLPVTDPEILHATTLLSWLRSARTAAAAPRLLLCARVVEQVSGWAGFSEFRSFSSQVLRLTWGLMRLRNDISDAAFAAGYELTSRGAKPSWFEHVSGRGGARVHLKEFLESFDDVARQIEAEGAWVPAVMLLAPALRTPQTSLAALRQRYAVFTQLEGRRVRTRNSLVHGGPLADRTVKATVEFAESIAALALGECIDGRLAERDLVDHFIEERRKWEEVEARLAAGEPLSEALFWGAHD